MAEFDEDLEVLPDVREAMAKARMNNENNEQPVLSSEYKDLFALGDEEFDISSIPDREANELTEEEIARLAGMQLDDIVAESESASIDKLFEKEATTTVAGTDMDDEIRETTLNDAEISVAQLLGLGNASSEPSGDSDEVQEESEDIQEFSKKDKKAKKDKKNKKKKSKKNKEEEVMEDGLPKKSFGQKVKGLFFELDESVPAKAEPKDDGKEHTILPANEDKLDENEKLLKERYGRDIDGDPLGEEAGAEKLGFFAKIKLLFAKKRQQNRMEDELEEEAFERDAEEQKVRKAARKEEKAANKAAREEAKKEAAAKEPKKEKKPKKEKPKKVKPKPEKKDLLRIKPITILGIIMFVSGMVILVSLASSTYHYNTSISNANNYFLNGNYSLAYETLSGVELDEEDKTLYDQICVVMFIEKQYDSHKNYKKLGMEHEALDSLIKGIARYQQYYGLADRLGVVAQFEAAKDKVVECLSEYGITYEKAEEYVALEKNDFVQYYHTIESYKKGE